MAAGASSDTARLQTQVTTLQDSINQQTQEIATLRDQINQGEEQIAPLETQIAEAQAAANQYTQMLQQWGQNREAIDANLNQIMAQVPAGLTIQSLSYADTISITGTTSSENDIFTFARNLRDIFANATINSINYDKVVGSFSFSLTINISQ